MACRLMPLAGALLLTLQLLAGASHAAPLRPDLIDPENPGRTIRGDLLIPKPVWIDDPPPVPAAGHRGVNQILVICIDYTDMSNAVSTGSVNNMVFGPWTPSSVNDYYQEISYGNLSLSGSVVGWYTASQARSYYGNNQYGFGTYPNNAAALAAEAIAAADAGGVDFSNYDNDGDGTAESIWIVHVGEGHETSADVNDIHSHYSTLSGMGDPSAPYTYDGKTVDPYLCVAELSASSPATQVKIGIWCHEYGHMLGLPDLYDAGNWCTGTFSHGIGVWGVMSYGCWGWDAQTPQRPTHMSAWAKIQMGWVTPTVVSSAVTGQTLPRVETNPTVLKVGMNTRPTEYFLLSYRDNTYGFDQGLPGTGLCIWHVDDEITSDNDCEQGGSCTSTSHFRVALEQPDGNFNLDCGTAFNYGDAGDIYPFGGNTSFTTSTTPSSDRYVGASSGTSITNIAVGGGSVTMNITPGTLYQYLVYDDGSCETGYSWGVDGYGFAQRVTPTTYPFTLKGAYVFSHNLYAANFQCQIWDDSGTGGTPGTAVSSVHTSSGALGLSWNYEDFSADNIHIASGDLWIVYIEYGGSRLGSDTNSPWNGRTMTYALGNFSPDNGAYGNYMIRGVGDLGPPVAVPEVAGGPSGLTLVHPNPFTSHTTLRLSLPRPELVTANVYDVRGRLMRRLLRGVLEPGERTIVWDGRNDAGARLAGGIYFCRLTVGAREEAHRLTLVR